MIPAFTRCFRSELLKTRRSFALWIVVVGAFFTPSIIIVARLVRAATLPALYSAEDFWVRLWMNSWESMAIFFLPLGVILATSLLSQIEYKNNTWKQLHTLPVGLTTVYLAKLSVILVLLAQFFVLFNAGTYLAAVIPWLLVPGVPYPAAPFPAGNFLWENMLYFVDCLPIVALQHLLALRFRNFIVPVGLGFLFWIGALSALPWKFGYLIPYTYCMLNYLKQGVQTKAALPTVDFHLIAAGYAAAFALAGLLLYLTKKEKG